MRIAQMTIHQQIENSASTVIDLIRTKNREFDSLFVCGNEDHRKGILSGLRTSDMAGRVKVTRDIPVDLDSANLQTLGQLKESIPNIAEYIAEDSVYGEKVY
jgi:hypothetical protein